MTGSIIHGDYGIQFPDASRMARVPRGWIDGLILSNNGTDATNDIDIAAGQATSSDNAQVIDLTSGLTKQLDANWAAGTNAGGRYSGAAITNTTYDCYLVSKAFGLAPDIYFHPYGSTDAAVLAHLQAETGGADYVHIRYIMSVMRTAATIKPFFQEGDNVWWVTPDATVLDYASQSTTATNHNTLVPLGRKHRVTINVVAGTSTAAVSLRVYSPQAADLANDIDVAGSMLGMQQTTSGVSRINHQVRGILTNTSGQVRVVANAALGFLTIITVGYENSRGRNA